MHQRSRVPPRVSGPTQRQNPRIFLGILKRLIRVYILIEKNENCNTGNIHWRVTNGTETPHPHTTGPGVERRLRTGTVGRERQVTTTPAGTTVDGGWGCTTPRSTEEPRTGIQDETREGTLLNRNTGLGRTSEGSEDDRGPGQSPSTTLTGTRRRLRPGRDGEKILIPGLDASGKP